MVIETGGWVVVAVVVVGVVVVVDGGWGGGGGPSRGRVEQERATPTPCARGPA